MGRADEVKLRRQLVSFAAIGVEPVAREDGQLSVSRECLQALLDGAQIAVRGRPSCQGKRFGVGHVGLQGVERVDVVESSQVVEPQNVAVQELRTLDEVADDSCTVGNDDAIRLLGRDGRRVAVRYRANAADALNDLCSVFGCAVLDDNLHAAETAAGNPGVNDFAALDFHLGAHMAFDAGDRVDN